MPRISQFHGIAIYMYYRDHAPPYFHAIDGNDEITVEISNASRLEGYLPPRKWSLVREWTEIRRAELEANWDRARIGQPLRPVPPL
jgi:hypothetical protein